MELIPIDPSIPVRIDTSVGTRVFAGSQMIMGDTGTRDVREIADDFDFSTSSFHKLLLRRVGDQVFMSGRGVRTAESQWITNILPWGFRPRSGEYNSLRGTILNKGVLSPLGNSATLLRLSVSGTTLKVGDDVVLNATWFTNDSWPTTLPGTPD